MGDRHHVVVIGGGFGGLGAVKGLRKKDVDVSLVDKHNYHLFWPLLYQVAMAGLSPGDIAAPLRAIFRKDKNVRVLMAEVSDIDPEAQRLLFANGDEVTYDTLVVAAGFQYHYFGHDEWAEHTYDMQGMEKALAIRRQILSSYELAEQELDPKRRQARLTFVIVGAGPTGIELAGSIAELARHALTGNFRRIDPSQSKVLLLEMADRVLPSFPSRLSRQAKRSLEKLGVSVRTGARVLDVASDHVLMESGGETERIDTDTVMWAAGVNASDLGKLLHKRTGVPLDESGRVKVDGNLSVPGYPNIFVVGDMTHYEQDGKPLPGLAPVAMQEGAHAAREILRALDGKETEPFHYADRGKMATIGRAAAVAEVGGLYLSGYIAWLLWLFVHLMALAGYRNRLLVFSQWAWSYVTFSRGVRLIVRPEEARNQQPAATEAELTEAVG